MPKNEPAISAKVVSGLVCMEILDTDVGAVHMTHGALATSHKGIVTGERAGHFCFSTKTI